MFFLQLELFDFLTWVFGFLLALTVHEAGHAFAADFLGDPTARLNERCSLNPLKHLDPFGTIFFFLAGFGWGKPVPVNPANFVSPRTGNILTALAGPMMNFCLALILTFPLRFLVEPTSVAFEFLQTLIWIQLILLVFNLLPIPPLDGGVAFAEIFPIKQKIWLHQNGPVFLFLLLAISYVFKFSLLSKILFPIVQILWLVIYFATGFGR